MARATYAVAVDWNDSGSFTDVGDDVTTRVLDGRTPVTFRYGRDTDRALSPIAPGEAHFALNNQSRAYSPENAASPLYGNVVPARPVQVSATLSGVTTVLFRGQLDDFTVNPAISDRYISVDCIDPLGILRGAAVSTGLYRGLRPGEAIHILLDAVGWPATARDIDTGATVMPYWWLDNDDAFDALMDLVYSEGPPALATVDTAGNLVFRDRHHRLRLSQSTTVQSTWRSSGVEPQVSPPADYNHGWKEIVNSVSFQLPQLAGAGVPSVVWQTSEQGLISITSGATVPIVAQATDPFFDAITPVQTTAFDADGNPNGDYTLVSGTVTVTLGRTSGLSTTIFVKAGVGGSAVISDLRLRATTVATVNTVQLQADDQASIAKYGRRTLTEDRSPKWASSGDAAAIATIILGQRAERLPTISVTMVSANATRLAQQLNRDLSDRVHLVEDHTGLDADCYIEQIAHEISDGGTNHRTTFGLEKIPAQITGAFVLGTSLLGTGKLGRRGFTELTSVFTLGSATNGVLGSDVLVP
jgi:hypothetical protein